MDFKRLRNRRAGVARSVRSCLQDGLAIRAMTDPQVRFSPMPNGMCSPRWTTDIHQKKSQNLPSEVYIPSAHLYSVLFRRLDCSGRQEALAKARRLGVFPRGAGSVTA